MNHMRRNHRLGLGFSAVTLALLSFNFLVIAQEQPPKTFRSSVDLVPVDVNVVDSNGRPVADLAAEDFALTVDGKPRRIVSAQFITVSRNTDAPEPPPTNYSSNAAAPGGRLVLIVIDQGNIGSGRGKYAIEAASRFVARLEQGRPRRPGHDPRRRAADRLHRQPRIGADDAAEGRGRSDAGRSASRESASPRRWHFREATSRSSTRWSIASARGCARPKKS